MPEDPTVSNKQKITVFSYIVEIGGILLIESRTDFIRGKKVLDESTALSLSYLTDHF